MENEVKEAAPRYKFKLYRNIVSLREYILVDSENVYVEKHMRQGGNSWLLSEIKNLTQHLNIESVGIDIALHDIYQGTSL